MKLGIIAAPEAKSFHYAKKLGLEFIEFDVNPKNGPYGKTVDEIAADLPELKKAREETGVEVGAVGRWASHILDAEGKVDPAEWSEVKKLIDFGAALGAKHYLCSVNYVPGITYYQNITAAIGVLRDIVAYAKERGMVTAIVNCMMGDNYIRTPEQWKLVLDEVPGLTIKYDPSHSFVHGGDQGAYIQEGLDWGDRFGYCHIKGVIQYGESDEPQMWATMDFAQKHPELMPELMPKAFGGHKRYDNPPAGIDSINWRAFFAILYKYGYDGYLSIEPHSSTWQGEKGEKGVEYTIKYIRDLMI